MKVTKQEVEKAKADYDDKAEGSMVVLLNGQLLDGAEAAWDKYFELKQEYENGNSKTNQ